MNKMTLYQRVVQDLISSLALHLAVQMDMNYDSFSEDLWEYELSDLANVRDMLIASGWEVPEVVTHMLEGGAAKHADARGGKVTKR